ncbi:hypothetical protein B0J17DRAFT_357881 [Rhizoctonia solani]|nr:hypothetical protein B0J17DRAFT_357881 [Rhizoctonia solani]
MEVSIEINRELQDMNNKREWRGGLRKSSSGSEEVRAGKFKDAMDSLDDVMRCYGRIRDHLQRVLLNANLSMWKIVDEFATDNRLDRLRLASSAFYNSAEAFQVKRGPCTTNTRINVLDELASWVETSKPGSVYWMSGMAGTGKTTISYSLCKQLQDSGRLAASFFCTRVLPECRHAERIIPSIAYQFARFSRPFRFALSTVLMTDPDAHARLPSLQFETLIVKPLLNIREKSTSPTNPPGKSIDLENPSAQNKPPEGSSVTDTLPENLVVVIDALDECQNKEVTRQVLKLLLSKPQSLPVKFVVSSRPEPEIREPMIEQTNQDKSRVVLHELE